MTEEITDFKCPVCRCMCDYHTAKKLDLGRTDYVVCNACFGTLERLRNAYLNVE